MTYICFGRWRGKKTVLPLHDFIRSSCPSCPLRIRHPLPDVERFLVCHLYSSYINPRPAGPLDFPPPDGGGGCLNTPPSISAPAHRRTKRKTAFESSRKIISKSYQSFFGSGQNWGHQGPKFQNFLKRFLDDTIFNFKGRATILIPSCLPRQGASNHV